MRKTTRVMALLAASLALCSVALAGNDILFQPAGFWPLCEAGFFQMNGGFCGGIVPGQEPYALMIRVDSESIQALEYQVSGTDKSGSVKSWHGYIQHFPGSEWEAAVINCGVLSSVSVTVHDLAVLSVRTMQ